MNLKKIIIVNFLSFMMAGILVSFNQNNSQLEPQAAVTETNRVWANAGTWWTNDGAETYIYAWKNSDSSAFVAWPGYRLINPNNSSNNKDNANNTYFVDIPTTYDRFKFNRVQPGTTNVWNESSVTNTLDGNTKDYKFQINGTNGLNAFEGLAVSSFSAVTTSIVLNLSESIDSSLEACSSSSAQTAIDTYNSMATFDQNQFDVLDVDSGEGVTTGIQRLQYLKDFYSIATIIN